jgi:putative ABC transport system permease protein
MRSLSNPPECVVYLPLSQGGFFGVFSVFVRTDVKTERTTALIQERLREIDPNLPVYGFRLMRDWVENSSARARIRTWVLLILSAVALTLGMIGIYSAAAGLGAAVMLASVLDALLFGVSARDPLTFAGVAVLLMFASLIACYVPARRAARTGPGLALRSE